MIFIYDDDEYFSLKKVCETMEEANRLLERTRNFHFNGTGPSVVNIVGKEFCREDQFPKTFGIILRLYSSDKVHNKYILRVNRFTSNYFHQLRESYSFEFYHTDPNLNNHITLAIANFVLSLMEPEL